MMSGYRRVAVAEEFFGILQQVHNKDCLHAGMRKIYAMVNCSLLNIKCSLNLQLYFSFVNRSRVYTPIFREVWLKSM